MKVMKDLSGELCKENIKIEYQDVFSKYANKLMNEYCLKVDDKKYNLIEIEFYFYDKENHPDPYIYCNEKQKECGKFYFHGSGMDITFGNGKCYGGILIRSIMNEEGQYINGSLKLLEELFCDEIDKLKIELIEKDIGKKNIFCSTRVGLQAHPLDYELLTKYENFIPYIFRLYRFIVDYSCSKNKCKDKTKIAFYEHLKNKNKPRPNYKQDSIKEN
jgi:hypothetical protein